MALVSQASSSSSLSSLNNKASAVEKSSLANNRLPNVSSRASDAREAGAGCWCCIVLLLLLLELGVFVSTSTESSSCKWNDPDPIWLGRVTAARSESSTSLLPPPSSSSSMRPFMMDADFIVSTVCAAPVSTRSSWAGVSLVSKVTDSESFSNEPPTNLVGCCRQQLFGARKPMRT
jgi:hypothetical protein